MYCKKNYSNHKWYPRITILSNIKYPDAQVPNSQLFSMLPLNLDPGEVCMLQLWRFSKVPFILRFPGHRFHSPHCNLSSQKTDLLSYGLLRSGFFYFVAVVLFSMSICPCISWKLNCNLDPAQREGCPGGREAILLSGAVFCQQLTPPGPLSVCDGSSVNGAALLIHSSGLGNGGFLFL